VEEEQNMDEDAIELKWKEKPQKRMMKLTRISRNRNI